MSLEFETIKIFDFVDEMKNGGTPRRNVSEYWENGTIPWLKTGEINNEIITENSEYITEEGLSNSSAKLLPINSVIMALYGKGTAGRVGLLKFEATTNQACCAMICEDKIKSEYLFFYLLSIQPQIELLANGSVQQNLSKDILAEYEIQVPKDYNTMNQIVWILKNIDRKIENNKQINHNLMGIADSIFQEKFCNFSHYDESELNYSDLGYIPKNWSYKTLDEISEVTIGKTPPRKEKEWFSETDGIKWVSIKDLGSAGTYIFDTTEYLTQEAVEKFNVNLVPKDTVILSFKLTVGRISITTENMVTNEAIAHFKLNEDTTISKEYLYLYLKNFNYETLGSTSSIAKAINSKIVKKIPVLIPKDEDLNWFAENMGNLFNTIKNNQIEINNLTKIRDTLLPKLMSGEIDVSEINCDLKLIIRKFIFKIISYLEDLI